MHATLYQFLCMSILKEKKQVILHVNITFWHFDIYVTCEFNNVGCRRTKYETIDPINLTTLLSNN